MVSLTGFTQYNVVGGVILSYLKQLNWIDILAVILLARICYVAIKRGLTTEIFKLLGIVCAIYLACHYYIRASIFLNSFLSLKGAAGVNFLNSLVFSVLIFLGYYFFVLIRVVFSFLIRMEAVSLLNHWGAFILGIARSCLFISLFFFIIAISNISYLKNTLSDSVLGPQLFKLTPKVYASLWNNLMSRFIDKEAFNQAVFQVKLKARLSE